jgi:Holliday junction resolvase RusA-like endonuclease
MAMVAAQQSVAAVELVNRPTVGKAPLVTLFVPGKPGPKGSTNRSMHGRTYNASAIGARWQATVAEACAHCKPVEPPYGLFVRFVMALPARHKYGWPVGSDLDKVMRATIDGLVDAGVISDDRHVTTMTATKKFSDSEEGALIALWRDT